MPYCKLSFSKILLAVCVLVQPVTHANESKTQSNLDDLFSLSLEQLLSVRVLPVAATEHTVNNTEASSQAHVVSSSDFHRFGYLSLLDWLGARDWIALLENRGVMVIQHNGLNTRGLANITSLSDIDIYLKGVERTEMTLPTALPQNRSIIKESINIVSEKSSLEYFGGAKRYDFLQLN